MYTIQQLQAADFLLKRLSNSDFFSFYNRKLKLVIELNGSYWYGDFVNFKDNYPIQFFIEGDGDVDYTRFYSDGINATIIFKKIIETYNAQTNKGTFYTNPFKKISTLDLLFKTIFELVDLADIKVDESPIYPYLLNARTLDGKLKLPFINLENQQINVVSFIDVTDVID
ncbi:hypothetical protein FJQ98_20620 [Lysinibacillus agricola]|uniref:Uncharacterized protein n=1 Tax=Lysinibacillus agricola TaxID=2590012 RepID=A0ABX7AP05_9BACI|nr:MULTISPECIES: hypothetical protein [Lysinibacillus]KOS60877.1 hypothetical protein AN161_20045 [Lysinibacillus sp. FJAT-14222]QQP11574.1 hypothetical protein FJQ98_20620 [Lysinibacillus agricola]